MNFKTLLEEHAHTHARKHAHKHAHAHQYQNSEKRVVREESGGIIKESTERRKNVFPSLGSQCRQPCKKVEPKN